MSLHHPSLWSVVSKQLKYKWLSYKSVFQGLMIVQVIAIVFSLLGVGNGSYGSSAFHLNVQFVSGDIVFFFTCIWAFFIALSLDRLENRLAEQNFVSNAMSHHMSNIMFIGVSNMIGSITVIAASFCVKLLHIWIYGLDAFVFFGEYTLSGLVTFFLTTFFYLMLFSGAGYLIGSIMRLGKMMKIATIVVVGGLIFYQGKRLEPVFVFFGQESHLLLFITKVLLTSLISFGLAVVFSRRLEVQ